MADRTININIQNGSTSDVVVGPFSLTGQGQWGTAPKQGDDIQEEQSGSYSEVCDNFVGPMGGSISFIALSGGGFTLTWDWSPPNGPTTSVTNNAGSSVTATSSLQNVGSSSVTVFCQVANASS